MAFLKQLRLHSLHYFREELAYLIHYSCDLYLEEKADTHVHLTRVKVWRNQVVNVTAFFMGKVLHVKNKKLEKKHLIQNARVKKCVI